MADFGIGEALAIASLAATAGSTFAQIQARKSQADAINEQAKFEAKQIEQNTARVIAKQHAIGAAAGLDTTTGSPLLETLDTARQGEIEALAARNKGRMAEKLARQQNQWTLLTGILSGASSLGGLSGLGTTVNTPTGYGAASGGVNLPVGLSAGTPNYSSYVTQ